MPRLGLLSPSKTVSWRIRKECAEDSLQKHRQNSSSKAYLRPCVFAAMDPWSFAGSKSFLNGRKPEQYIQEKRNKYEDEHERKIIWPVQRLSGPPFYRRDRTDAAREPAPAGESGLYQCPARGLRWYFESGHFWNDQKRLFIITSDKNSARIFWIPPASHLRRMTWSDSVHFPIRSGSQSGNIRFSDKNQSFFPAWIGWENHFPGPQDPRWSAFPGKAYGYAQGPLNRSPGPETPVLQPDTKYALCLQKWALWPTRWRFGRHRKPATHICLQNHDKDLKTGAIHSVEMTSRIGFWSHHIRFPACWQHCIPFSLIQYLDFRRSSQYNILSLICLMPGFHVLRSRNSAANTLPAGIPCGIRIRTAADRKMSCTEHKGFFPDFCYAVRNFCFAFSPISFYFNTLLISTRFRHLTQQNLSFPVLWIWTIWNKFLKNTSLMLLMSELMIRTERPWSMNNLICAGIYIPTRNFSKTVQANIIFCLLKIC